MQRNRLTAIGLGLVLAAAPLFSQQEQIAFKLTGGLVLVQGDDYNKGIAGANRILTDIPTLSGGYKELRTGRGLTLEIINYWGPHFGVGIGGGFYETSNESGISGQLQGADGPYAYASQYFPKVSAIPFFLNLHYRTRLTTRLGLDVFAGPVFQIIQFGFRRQETAAEDVLSEVETFKASANDLGAQAGIDLNVHITRGLSLVAGGSFRAAKISNFQGNWLLSTTTSSGTVTNTSSAYYFWLYDFVGNGITPHFGFFDANGPIGTAISGARKGELNLTGFQASIGISLGF